MHAEVKLTGFGIGNGLFASTYRTNDGYRDRSRDRNCSAVPVILKYASRQQCRAERQRNCRREAAGSDAEIVAKDFYNELANYGVRNHEIVQVASHLLDNLLATEKKPAEGVEYYSTMFTVASVRDEWVNRKQLGIQHVTLRPLELSDVSRVFVWMQVPAVSESFVPPFPEAKKSCESISQIRHGNISASTTVTNW